MTKLINLTQQSRTGKKIVYYVREFYRSSFPGNIIKKTSKFSISRAHVLVSSVVMRLKRSEIRETSKKKINDKLNLGNRKSSHEYVFSKCGSLFIWHAIRVRLTRCSTWRFPESKATHACECFKTMSSFAFHYRTLVTNEIDSLFLWLGRERWKRNVGNQRGKGKCEALQTIFGSTNGTYLKSKLVSRALALSCRSWFNAKTFIYTRVKFVLY